MFCPNCGTKNEDSAVFCESCGSRILEEGTQPPVQVQPDYPGYSMTKVQQQPLAQNYVYQQASVAIVKKPISLKAKMIAAVILVVVILVAVFFAVGNSMSNPDKIANNYFEQLQKQNWEKAYSYLDITESDFVNKTTYVNLQKSNKDQANIENFSIVSEKNATDTSSNKNGLTKNIDMQYTVKGSSSVKTMTVRLIRQKEKVFLFFDTWKVSSADMIAPSYTIQAPKGLKVFLDGVQIADKYLEKEDSNDNNSATATYTLKNVFIGSHSLKATSEYTEDYTKDIDIVDGSDDAVVDKITFKKDVINTVGKQAGDTLTAIYTAALAGKDFSEVKQYFSADADVQTTMQSKYADIVDTISKDSQSVGLKSITFSNFQPTSTDNEYTNMQLSIQLNYDYIYSVIRSSYFSTVPTEEYTSPSAQSDNKQFVFVLENGKWVIKDCSSLRIYYY